MRLNLLQHDQADYFTYSEHVIHKRSSSRTELHQVDACGLSALRDPFCNEPYPKQFTEDLTDLWRCDKVSFSAELVSFGGRSRGVISTKVRSKALAHVRSHWYWSSGLLESGQRCL